VAEPSKAAGAQASGEPRTDANAQPSPKPTCVCILIIEDSPGQLEHIVSILRDAGHDAHGAEDWSQCRAALTRIEPQLVILDVNLSGMQGGDILAIQLKKHPKTNKACIIFHSASKETDLQLMVRRTGVDGYIVKSNKDAHFIEAVQHFLELKAAERESKN
jgi:CheY-like chemotaxis protein